MQLYFNYSLRCDPSFLHKLLMIMIWSLVHLSLNCENFHHFFQWSFLTKWIERTLTLMFWLFFMVSKNLRFKLNNLLPGVNLIIFPLAVPETDTIVYNLSVSLKCWVFKWFIKQRLLYFLLQISQKYFIFRRICYCN